MVEDGQGRLAVIPDDVEVFPHASNVSIAFYNFITEQPFALCIAWRPTSLTRYSKTLG